MPRWGPSGSYRIVAIAGSLRRGSFDRALLHAAGELAPDGMTIETGELPFFNADVEAARFVDPVRPVDRPGACCG